MAWCRVGNTQSPSEIMTQFSDAHLLTGLSELMIKTKTNDTDIKDWFIHDLRVFVIMPCLLYASTWQKNLVIQIMQMITFSKYQYILTSIFGTISSMCFSNPMCISNLHC